MKYLTIISSLIALALLSPSCVNSVQESGEQQSLMEASKQELATALEERDQLLTLVEEIATGMDRIKHLENIMTLTGTQPNENPAQRAQLISDLAILKKTLRQRREQLEKLEAGLNESSIHNNELKSGIDALRKLIDSQAADIDHLRSLLDSANERIVHLNDEVDSLNSTVEEVNQSLDIALEASLRLENELNTCYYVVATKSQLKEHQIIETGFLRKSKLLKGDFDRGFFVIGDKRNLHTINLGGGKAKVYTNHPENSYEIAGQDTSRTLTITNPDEFWSLTNYLVIQVD